MKKKRRLKISLNLPKKSTCFAIKLRRIIGNTPAGGDQDQDIFIMQDIGRKKPWTIVQDYETRGLHVLQMFPIPDWEGQKS